MSRNRNIKPEFCKSVTLNRISLESNLFFILMWMHCDDFGTILNSNRYLIGQCFPIRETVSEKNIETWKQELIKENLIIPVKYSGQDLLIMRSWEEHQKVPNPSARNNIDMESGITEIKAIIDTLIRKYLESNEKQISDKLESNPPMFMSMSMSKNKSKSKNNEPLPAESDLEEIFYNELKQKCKKLNLEFVSYIDSLKAKEKFLIYLEYCKKYYGTKKQYKDYNSAARTFQSKIKEFENYKKPEAKPEINIIQESLNKPCKKPEPIRYNSFSEICDLLFKELGSDYNVEGIIDYMKDHSTDFNSDRKNLDKIYKWAYQLKYDFRIQERPTRQNEKLSKSKDVNEILNSIGVK